MLSVVYCKDSSKARSERERVYDAHVKYLISIKDRICFVGPLATTDDARGKGDENLVGSVFVMDEPPSAVQDLLHQDPYMQSGVWHSFLVFEAVDVFGQWPTGEARRGAELIYVSLARQGDGHLVSRDVALFGAKLHTETALQEVGSEALWSAAAIYTAISLAAARSVVAKELANKRRKIETWAIPIALGSWIPTRIP